ncbi:hypothetical protein [Streptomyces sp. NPDC047061]|uniref:hypothetical protein n=1 Tax=Streptomyces sp. NPDC047061 TaxID=3154605 RepID=UPI003410827D
MTGIGHDAAQRFWYRALTECMASVTDYHAARFAPSKPPRTCTRRTAGSTPRSARPGMAECHGRRGAGRDLVELTLTTVL